MADTDAATSSTTTDSVKRARASSTGKKRLLEEAVADIQNVLDALEEQEIGFDSHWDGVTLTTDGPQLKSIKRRLRQAQASIAEAAGLRRPTKASKRKK